MGLFLLGIPLAIVGAKILHDDVKYTTMNLKTDKGALELHKQYEQIDRNFKNILDYSGAKCKFKNIGYDKYEIYDVQKGQYGGMERYLAQKGYYPQAIQYAKDCFDKIADEESAKKQQKRNQRINNFEKKLLSKKTKTVIIRNKICTVNLPRPIVEKEIEKLINYFNTHHNQVHCNIIMGGTIPYQNHEEVWHINKPIDEDVCQYYFDVCDKLNIKWKE